MWQGLLGRPSVGLLDNPDPVMRVWENLPLTPAPYGAEMRAAGGDFRPLDTVDPIARMSLRAGVGQTVPQTAAMYQQATDAATNWAGTTPLVGGGIRAFHGSPHDFDRFRMDRIGTGEGAQAYGHGLYFAGNEDVARTYRNAGAPQGPINGRVFLGDNEMRGAMLTSVARELGYGPGTSSALYNRLTNAADIEDYFKQASSLANSLRETMPSVARDLDREIQLATALRGRGLDVRGASPGRMYEVRLNVDPNRLLDWDAPLSGQSPEVVRAIETLPYGRAALNVQTPAGSMRLLEDFASSQGLREGADTRGYGYGARRAAEDLRGAGVPGVRYLDAGSRTAGDGTRNYVMFDDSLIEILRKYGIAGLGILSGGAFGGGLLDQPTIQ